MFTLTDTPIKFVVLLLLFAFTTVWSIYEVAHSRGSRQIVSNGSHLVMSVVMLLMVPRSVWRPTEGLIGLPVFIVFFALCVAWFVWLGIDTLRHGGTRSLALHFFGHAAMMGAMTWHLGGMAVKMSLMQSGAMKGTGAGHTGMQHGGMQHGGAAGQMAGQGPTPMFWVALIGLPLMAYLLVASIQHLRLAFTRLDRPASASRATRPAGAQAPVLDMAGCHDPRPVGGTPYRAHHLSGFAMNFGMFWMSTGLLTAILPFMKYLAF